MNYLSCMQLDPSQAISLPCSSACFVSVRSTRLEKEREYDSVPAAAPSRDRHRQVSALVHGRWRARIHVYVGRHLWIDVTIYVHRYIRIICVDT